MKFKSFFAVLILGFSAAARQGTNVPQRPVTRARFGWLAANGFGNS